MTTASMHLVFWCDAGPVTGYGHLSRCLTLAREARMCGVPAVSFLADTTNEQAIQRVTKEGFNVLQASGLGNHPVDVIVLDLSSARLLTNIDSVHQVLREARQLARKVVWFDSVGGEAVVNFSLGRLDVVVSPYLGAEKTQRPDCDLWLAGAAFAVISRPGLVGERKPSFDPDRLLVSMGGSDRALLSERVLAVAAKFPRLKIRLVAGPYFSAERIAAIESAFPTVEVVQNRDSLWHDFSESAALITAVGLTRYEAAVAEIPTLILSTSQRYRAYLSEFEESGFANLLFIDESPDTKHLARAIERLLTEPGGWRGRVKIDCLGGQRVIRALV